MTRHILKVFFDASSSHTNKEIERNKEIISILSREGCNIIQTVMGTDLDPALIKGAKGAKNLYATKLNDIKKSDILVCEISKPSLTISFEISEALEKKKPVLALFTTNSETSLEAGVYADHNSLFFPREYNRNNLAEIVKEFIKKSERKALTKRFTVRVSEEIESYLKYLKAKNDLSSRNDVVNDIINKEIINDEGFQAIKK